MDVRFTSAESDCLKKIDNNCLFGPSCKSVNSPTTEKVNKVTSKFDWPLAMCLTLTIGGLATVAVGIASVNPLVAVAGAVAVAVGVVVLCILGIVRLVSRTSSTKIDARKEAENRKVYDQTLYHYKKDLDKVEFVQVKATPRVETPAGDVKTPPPVVSLAASLLEGLSISTLDLSELAKSHDFKISPKTPTERLSSSSPLEDLSIPTLDLSELAKSHDFKISPKTPTERLSSSSSLEDLPIKTPSPLPITKRELKRTKSTLRPETPRTLTPSKQKDLKIQSDRDALKLAILDIDRFNSSPSPEGQLHLNDAIQRRASSRAELMLHTRLGAEASDEELIAEADKKIGKA